jgi:hypothetical protein
VKWRFIDQMRFIEQKAPILVKSGIVLANTTLGG